MSSAPLPARPPGRSLLRWVSTANPFYVVSAALFLLGLQLSFGTHARETDAWALTGGLTGYTLMLASAALVLVRFAGVWDDVRTVLLLVVLMFLATSVTFDELLVLDYPRGVPLCVGGLVFAVAVTEGLLRGIRLRLPPLYRLPYYLTLALFFAYPVVLAPFARDPHSEPLLWGLWGFAPAAGLVFLSLIPAARCGPDAVRASGSPWGWPYFPWAVFVFLAVAVGGRAFLLCWSFHLLPGGGQLIFGPYFLVPFGLALAVVVLELGLTARNRPTQWTALAAPLLLAAVAGLGHREDAVYAEFLDLFAARLGGTPMFVALVAAAGFYLYGWVRSVPLATEGLTAALAAMAVVGPRSLAPEDVSSPRPELLAAAVVLQVWLGLWRRDGWRLLAAGTVAGVGLGVAAYRGYRELRQDVVGLDYLVAGLALLPVAVVVSLVKSGAVARWLTARGRTPTPAS